jgi:hypothetical protein
LPVENEKKLMLKIMPLIAKNENNAENAQQIEKGRWLTEKMKLVRAQIFRNWR